MHEAGAVAVTLALRFRLGGNDERIRYGGRSGIDPYLFE